MHVATPAAPAAAGAEAPRAPGVRARAAQLFARHHVLPAIVLVVLVAVSGAMFLALRGVVHTQERRLLHERAEELGAYLQASTTQTSSQLAAAGQDVAADGPHAKLFPALATPLAATGAVVSVAQRFGASYRTVTSVGGTANGVQPLNRMQRDLVARAVRAGGLVYSLYPGVGGTHIVEAVPAPSAKTPTVALLDTLLPPPRPIPTTKDSPYRELDVVLYASTKPDPSRIVLISGAIPAASSNPVRVVIKVGASKVLLVAVGHHALVGTFTQSVPWIVFISGLVLAVLLAVLVEVLTRRRAYALGLVEQRTRAMYQAQLAAEAANRSKSEFLSRMSHELRTPLNAVLGFSQLLELDELDADQEKAVGQITKGGRHLLDLINEILDISQIETGKLALSPEAVRIGDIIGETST